MKHNLRYSLTKNWHVGEHSGEKLPFFSSQHMAPLLKWHYSYRFCGSEDVNHSTYVIKVLFFVSFNIFFSR